MTATSAPSVLAVSERQPLRHRIPWRQIAIYALALVFAIYLLAPFAWIVITSFMTEADALTARRIEPAVTDSLQ